MKTIPVNEDNHDELYTFDAPKTAEKSHLTLIPYYAWANRDEKQMNVWIQQARI
ncbi:hypothetical protein [Lentilactobacillus buchneri]|uniref:hypothetical protein n=1 Tax=Lentilactobacillus buchneri TaxID=1581 RepID=UPI00145EA6CB|nr:hypothetical protein [Lentilactobacillus buchneri]MCV3742197.1 hypothetical protein [Lentilactobacillus hilgardii]